MRYVAIDLETSGLYDDITMEVAGVLEDTDLDTPVEELPFYQKVGKPTAFQPHSWGLEAMKMHVENGLIDELLVEGCESTEVMWLGFLDWLKGLGFEGKIVLAGKNAGGFDRPRLPPVIQSLTHHRVIDPGSVFMDWTQAAPPSMKDLGFAGQHRALEDARNVVRCLRRAYRAQ